MKLAFWLNRGTDIYCRITVQGLRAEISTEMKTSKLTNGRTGDSITDTRLAEIEYKLRKIELALDLEGLGYSARDIKRVYKKGRIRLATPNLLNIMLKKDKIYLATISHLKDFLKGNNPKLSEIDQAFANNFAEHLLSKTKASSANIYFSKVIASLHQAIINHPKQTYPDMITEIPFERPQILTEQKEQSVVLKYLTVAQYESLIALKLYDEQQEFYRYCFMWQCLTGMAMADINKFSENMVFNDISGKQYIKYVRVKTSSEAFIPITDDIRKLYVLFPLTLTEAKYNYHLKQIGKMIGIPNLTSHYGRHTAAVTWLTQGYSMESVSKQMGHTSITTTERVYAKVTLEKLFAEQGKLNYI